MGKKERVIVLLDRDGVLCDNGIDGIHTYSAFKLVPGINESLRKLNRENFWIGVITNQPDVSRGLLKRRVLERMNGKLRGRALESGIGRSRFAIKVCPHTKEDYCGCRKSKTGLIKQVMKQFSLKPERCRFYIVGDQLRDAQTLENYYNEVLRPLKVPRRMITTILLKWRYGERKESKRLMTDGSVRIRPDFELRSLKSAINLIIKLEKSHS